MICAYNLIDSGRTNYNELKSDGYRNAIEALVAARAIRKVATRSILFVASPKHLLILNNRIQLCLQSLCLRTIHP